MKKSYGCEEEGKRSRRLTEYYEYKKDTGLCDLRESANLCPYIFPNSPRPRSLIKCFRKIGFGELHEELRNVKRSVFTRDRTIFGYERQRKKVRRWCPNIPKIAVFGRVFGPRIVSHQQPLSLESSVGNPERVWKPGSVVWLLELLDWLDRTNRRPSPNKSQLPTLSSSDLLDRSAEVVETRRL